MDASLHIPLFRFGRLYESLDTAECLDFRGNSLPVCVSQANAGLVRRDLQDLSSAFEAVQSKTTEEMFDICLRAGDFFLNARLPVSDSVSHSPDEYVSALSSTGGLPESLCRANMQKIHHVLRHMREVVGGLTRGLNPEVLDRGIAGQNGLLLGFYAAARCLGVVLPSNSPGVNSLWLPSVALRVPVVLKPGREDPWTPWRIIQAFLAAGCPPEAFGFYPTGHEGSNAVLERCDRAILFGDRSTVERHVGNLNVSVHGPGHSKILVGEDSIDRWEDFLDVMTDSVAANSGRSCVNASTIVVPRHGRALAETLARELTGIKPAALDNPDARLAGFANKDVAEWTSRRIDEGVQSGGVEGVSSAVRGTGRLVERDGLSYVAPTVVYCPDCEHELARSEFLFPYVAVTEVPEDRMLEWTGPSLVVTAITANENFQRALLNCRHIDRLNLGPLSTASVRWDQPHEGNLFEFLYRRRAIQEESFDGG